MSKHIKKIPHRIVIYAKDIENMMGLRESGARRYLRKLREVLKKTRDQFITYRDLCLYAGLEEELVKEFLVD